MNVETAAEQDVGRPRRDFFKWMRGTPYLPLFGLLVIGWLLLFHFLGNSAQGYFKMSSLFGWMGATYNNFPDDRFGGFYMPFIALGILWWKRGDLAALPKQPSWVGLTIAVSGLLLHVLGYLVQQSRISIIGFYFGLWGLVGAVWGLAMLRATFFPFCLLVFCVPLSSLTDTITFPLRQFATAITVKIAHGLGIDVQQAGAGGTVIYDPSGRYKYEVAAACSGLRSLTAIFALTTLYSFVFFRRGWKRACIIMAAFPLAIISNVLRLLMIVIAAEAFGEKAGNVVHENAVISLLPYIVGFVGVLLLGRAMKEDCDVDFRALAIPVGVAVGAFWVLEQVVNSLSGHLPKDSTPTVFLVLATVAVAAICFPAARGRLDFSGRALAVAALMMFAMVAAAGLLADRRTNQKLSAPGVKVVREPMHTVDERGSNQVVVSESSVFLPPSVLNYRSSTYPVQKIVYDWLPKDTTYGQRFYVSSDGSFGINNMVVLMGADRTSIHEPQYCLTAQGYTIVDQERDTIRIHRPTPYDLPVMKLKFQGQTRRANGERREVGGVFVYWFVSETNLSAEHGRRMWQTGWNMIRTGVLERWAYVIAMAFNPVGQEEAAYERLKEFITASVPEYQITVGHPVTELTSAQSPSGK